MLRPCLPLPSAAPSIPPAPFPVRNPVATLASHESKASLRRADRLRWCCSASSRKCPASGPRNEIVNRSSCTRGLRSLRGPLSFFARGGLVSVGGSGADCSTCDCCSLTAAASVPASAFSPRLRRPFSVKICCARLGHCFVLLASRHGAPPSEPIVASTPHSGSAGFSQGESSGSFRRATEHRKKPWTSGSVRVRYRAAP